jgi:transcriptional regulator with XRE-family HTH domain
MPNAPGLIREARLRAGLSQSGLAKRLGVAKLTVERLERPNSNPTVDRLDVILWATGHRLVLRAVLRPPTVDENLIRESLKLAPAERLRRIETMYVEERRRMLAARDAGDTSSD